MLDGRIVDFAILGYDNIAIPNDLETEVGCYAGEFLVLDFGRFAIEALYYVIIVIYGVKVLVYSQN